MSQQAHYLFEDITNSPTEGLFSQVSDTHYSEVPPHT